jgi:hypothetical protein
MRYWFVAVAAVVAVSSVTSACGKRYPAAPSASQSAALLPGSDASPSVPHRATARNSEQLGFSGVATEGTGAPVGFWIWCEVDSRNGYNEECNGSMYFYALGITKHVIDVEDGITEGANETYTIRVHSTLDDSIACTLANAAEPEHGPHNTVTIDCTSPAGVHAVSNTAVVNVTGPGD